MDLAIVTGKQISYLQTNPEKDIVSTMFNWLEGKKLIPRPEGGMTPKDYLAGKTNGPVCASIVSSKAIYDKIGPFNQEMLGGSDGDWNFRALRLGFEFGFIPERLYTQRRHPRQISKRLGANQRANHRKSQRL